MSVQTAAATSLILTEDFFGVVANQLFQAIASGTKPERKDAFLTIRQMAKTARVLSSKEKILSIGIGVNISGQRHIAIALEAPPATQTTQIQSWQVDKGLTARRIINALINDGLRYSTWCEQYTEAWEDLEKYKGDMIAQVERELQ